MLFGPQVWFYVAVYTTTSGINYSSNDDWQRFSRFSEYEGK